MPLSGSLTTMPCEEILAWISTAKKTGLLNLERAGIAKHFFFEKGSAVSSGSNDAREYLGQFFISFGKLSEEDLVKAYKVQKETKVYLGKILVMIGKASEAQVQRVLSHKTTESLLDCFLWTDGKFQFEVRETAMTGPQVEVSLDTQRLREEGVARIQEWKDLKALIADAKAPIHVCRNQFPSGFPEKPDDKKLIDLLEAGKKIPDIGYEFHMSEFLVTKKIAQLIQRGLLSMDGVPAGKPAVVTPPKKESLSELLQAGQKKFVAGEFAAAQEIFQKLLEREPNHAAGNDWFRKSREKHLERLEKDLDPNRVPNLIVKINTLGIRNLSVEEGYVLSRINGDWSIQEIIQVCPFDKDKVLEALRRFLTEKLISFKPI